LQFAVESGADGNARYSSKLFYAKLESGRGSISMERAMLPVVPMRPTHDKRSRLMVVAPYIKNGTVLFPRSGCEQLLAQLFNFGVEGHDDLVDALVYLILGLVEQGLELPKIHWIEG
jgi:phage terminase large subunit-like protein